MAHVVLSFRVGNLLPLPRPIPRMKNGFNSSRSKVYIPSFFHQSTQASHHRHPPLSFFSSFIVSLENMSVSRRFLSYHHPGMSVVFLDSPTRHPAFTSRPCRHYASTFANRRFEDSFPSKPTLSSGEHPRLQTRYTRLISSIVAVAVAGAGTYLYKLSQGPEVVWDRSGDWRPWDKTKYDQNVSWSEPNSVWDQY